MGLVQRIENYLIRNARRRARPIVIRLYDDLKKRFPDSETLRARKMDQSIGTPAAAVAKAYVASVEGTGSGEVIDAAKFK